MSMIRAPAIIRVNACEVSSQISKRISTSMAPGITNCQTSTMSQRSPRWLRGCLKTCHVRQTMHHQADHGHADRGFARLGYRLAIL
jgi:hypothetical protein